MARGWSASAYAHGVAATGGRFKRKPPASDHWHRTEADPGLPYQFKNAETLIDDFFEEVERVLDERGIGTTVVEVEETRRVEMTKYKVQNLRSLREEMKAVARGERAAPAGAVKPSFNSVDAVVRLLTPENRQLLAIIRDRKPQSVAELVELSGRAQPNLTRTLAKMESAGFITMKVVGRRKAPSVAVKKIVVEIDPYSDRDRLNVA
jgi:predicted transcriptional regulator